MLNNVSPLYVGQFLAKLSRPQNSLYPGLLAAVTYVALTTSVKIYICLALYSMIFCIYAAAATYNNMQDVESDRINKREDNPLVTYEIPMTTIRLFLLFLLCTIVLLLYTLSQPLSTIVVALYVVLSGTYSGFALRLKAHGMWGIFTLSLCYSALPIIIGAGQTEIVDLSITMYVVSSICMLSIAGLLAKDYKDRQGDQKTHTKTPIIRYGVTNTRLIAGIFYLVACLGILLKTQSFIIILSALLYGLVILYIHWQKGKAPHILLRTSHICLLLLSWNLLQESMI